VAQLDFGAPLFDTLIALTDLMKAPLDRAALKKELTAEVAELLGTPGIEPRAIIVSASAAGVIISAHNAKVAPPGSPLTLANGAVAAVGTPWGLALSPTSLTDPQPIADALASPNQGLALAGVKLLDDKASYFRGYADLTRLPPEALSAFPQDLIGMVRSVAFSASSSRFDAQIGTAPGQAKPLAAKLLELGEQAAPPEVADMYKDRAKASALQEAMAIITNFQRNSIREFLTPTSMSDDQLVFTSEMSQPQMQVVASAAVIGIAAAVAIPAFMAYQLRGLAPPGASGLDDLPGGGAGVDAKTQEELEQEMKEQMERIEQEMKELEAADGAATKPARRP
jgi:hypothetical protein